MKIIETLINERIISLRIEVGQDKDRNRWANCLSLSGGISELQGLLSEISTGERCEKCKNFAKSINHNYCSNCGLELPDR